MLKLINAGIRRYLTSILFWFAVIATVINACWCGYFASKSYFPSPCIIIELVIFAILISWLTGREYSEGIFRNKIISGHIKVKIFLSEIILGLIACTVLFLIFTVIFTCQNTYVFTFVSTGLLVKIFIDTLLVNLCFASISVSVSCLVPHMAATIIANTLLVLALVFISEAMVLVLDGSEPEYITEYEYQQVTRYENDGTAYNVDVAIPGTAHKIKNPDYVDNSSAVFYKLYNVLFDILPFGHIIEYTSFTEGWFGLEAQRSAQKYTEIIYYVCDGINTNIIYSIFVLLAVCGIGAFCFRRSDLK